MAEEKANRGRAAQFSAKNRHIGSKGLTNATFGALAIAILTKCKWNWPG